MCCAIDPGPHLIVRPRRPQEDQKIWIPGSNFFDDRDGTDDRLTFLIGIRNPMFLALSKIFVSMSFGIISKVSKRDRTTMRSLRHTAVRLQRGVVSRRRYASSPVPVAPPQSSVVDLQASAKIEGEESQIATISLQPGQTLRAESGSMIYMTEGVQMETSSSGVSSAMKRFMTGQNLFVTDFTYDGKDSGTVALGTDFPSKILRLHLNDYPNQTLVCQKGAYLASNMSVNIELAFTKSFTSGFFGGEGFVLQKLEGDGDVLIKAGGTLVKKELDEGETLRVSSGSLVAFTSTVDYGTCRFSCCVAALVRRKEHPEASGYSILIAYVCVCLSCSLDVQMMPGFKNVMFGGEGLFITTLKGPGTVWLQGMPQDRMVSEIVRRLPPGGLGFGIPIGMGGSAGGEGEQEGGGSEEVLEGGGGGDAGGGEAVAATDAAMDADRQATVASSDPGSPSALFGDAAPDEPATAAAAADDVPELQDESEFGQDTWQQQDESTFTDDPKFDEGFGEESFSTEDSFGDGGFQEDTSFSTFDESVSEASEGGSSILSTLWDLFTGGDE